MNAYDERVTLSGEDLDLVYGQRLVVDAIDFNYGHIVSIDGEIEPRVTGDRNQTHSITIQMVEVSIQKGTAWLKSWTYRLPASTLITARSETGAPGSPHLPRPLIKVVSALLR